MKPLNDSCYVVPEKNPRVFQDTNPVKNQAFKAALNKYEQQVQFIRSENEKFMRSHYDGIKRDHDDYLSKESERKA